MLYSATTSNPESTPWEEADFAYLIRVGAAPEDFTAEDLDALPVSPDGRPDDSPVLHQDSAAMNEY